MGNCLDHHVAEHDAVGMAQSRKHVRSLFVGEGVEAAAQRLAIDGDGRHPFGRSRYG